MIDSDRLWRAVGSSIEGARQHGLSSWFHLHPPKDVKAKFRNTFGSDYRRTTAANLLLRSAANEALDVLESAGVPVIPLKGFWFASRYYGDLGVRSQTDIDILVRRSDRARAHTLLTADGWAEAVDRDFYKGHYHWVYKKDGHLLELHWALRSPGLASPDPALFWESARPIRREGREILELPVETELLVLAVNKAHHGYSRAADFLDMAVMVEAGVKWKTVVEEARRSQVHPALWFGLAHLPETTGTKVPAASLNKLGKGRRVWPAKLLLRWGKSLPSVRLREAALEGSFRRVWTLAKPLLFPSKARVRETAGGSLRRYYSRLFP